MGTSWFLPYVDVVFGFRGFESKDIPGYTVVEAVFTYLNWKTSSMVGKVCVCWLSVNHSGTVVHQVVRSHWNARASCR